MRVRFATTLDDVVDANLRALSRSKVDQSWSWEDIVYAVLFFGVFLYAVIPEDRAIRLLIFVSAMALWAVTYRHVGGFFTKRYFRRFFKERLGDDVPYDVTVELSPGGISTRWLAQRWDFEWASIETILETPDSVDFHTRFGGILVVRKRAFDSPGAMRQFVELAERYRADAERPGRLVN